MERAALRNDQWEGIKDLLSGESTDCGATATNNRRFIEAVLWIARTGAPWPDLSEKFGYWYRVYVRYTGGLQKAYGIGDICSTFCSSRLRILNGGWKYRQSSSAWRATKNGASVTSSR